MSLSTALRQLPARHPVLLAGAAGLAALAGANRLAARSAERRHPPDGAFLEVDGVRLHYRDQGRGHPVVLVHGNAVTGEDFGTSGIAESLIRTHRVITFDRPGFGYSERPRSRIWTAEAQAGLIHAALARLGVRRPVVVGHSWGTLVALALAARHPADTAGLVLVSGYYFPTPRLDALLVAPTAAPVLGDVLRYTVAPLLGRLLMPAFKRLLFAPAPTTARFKREYSAEMALRPSQVRATAADGALMVPSARRLRASYRELALPVVILAGRGDLVVGTRQAERLHAAIPGSALRIVEGVGHMLHHVATGEVIEAVEEITDALVPALPRPPVEAADISIPVRDSVG